LGGLALAGVTSRHFYRLYILGLLLLYCGLFYYFGEIIDVFGWDALRWEFFYGVHDVHRLFFLAPVLYSAFVFGLKATSIITIISAAMMMPRALFISPYPDPLIRMLLSMAVIGAMGYLTAKNRQEAARRRRIEVLLRGERDKLSGILERMEDGVVVVGPDHRIRFMNPSMVREFGEGVGTYCYRRLYELEAPCAQHCRLKSVLRGAIERWAYVFPDGRSYEVLASPYTDHDGVVCQLATYRNTSISSTNETLSRAGGEGISADPRSAI
jgi:PAS domain-containing protein